MSGWNVWAVVKEMLTVEPRTEVVMSSTDASLRTYAVPNLNRRPL
jgi:hypothetical protein